MPSKNEYPDPPPLNYDRKQVPVGQLNFAADNLPGPQRDTPFTGTRWRVALSTRAKKYGEFNPLLVTDRVVSRRADGVMYPLDGNGSNHWYEGLYGPAYRVPCRVVEGLTLAEENRIFQAIQAQRKPVTRAQQYYANVHFDAGSMEARIGKVLETTGFHTSAAVNDPWGIGVTAVEFVYAKRGEAGLSQTLRAIAEIFPDDDPARTNASLFKGLAMALGNADFDQALLFPIVHLATARALSANARGRASEDIVLARIREMYQDAVAQGLTEADLIDRVRQVEAEAAEREAEAAGQQGDLLPDGDEAKRNSGVPDIKWRQVQAGGPEAGEADQQRAQQDADAEGEGEGGQAAAGQPAKATGGVAARRGSRRASGSGSGGSGRGKVTRAAAGTPG